MNDQHRSYKTHSFGEEFLPSVLPAASITAVGYCTAEKEAFPGPHKIIAAIPANFHLSYCLDRSGNPVGVVLLTKDGIYDSHV